MQTRRERKKAQLPPAVNLTCPLFELPDPDTVAKEEASRGKDGLSRRPVRKSRQASRVSYKEDHSEDDKYIYCEDCDEWFRGDCPNCGPLLPLNSEQRGSWPGSSVHTSLPIPPEIRIRKSYIHGAGLGAFARTFIPKGTRVGPYTGDIIAERDIDPEQDCSYMWEVVSSEGGEKVIIDGKSERTANWMRFVNCARNEEEQNLGAYQYQGEIYYRSLRNILPGVELLMWYGSQYATELGISADSPSRLVCDTPSSNATSNKTVEVHASNSTPGSNSKQMDAESERFHCDECSYASNGSGDFVRHKRIHSGEKPYKCDQCSYACSVSGNLATHKGTHSGQKPYKCDQCSYVCSHLSYLVAHKRTHSRAKR